MIPAKRVADVQMALPFWMSLLLLPLVAIGAGYGGWTVLLLPLVTWYFFSLLDAVLGLNLENNDLETTDAQLG